MHSADRGKFERILRVAGAEHERELPGAAQRAVRRLVRMVDADTLDGLVALVDFGRQRGYVDALADVEALGDVVVDVRSLPERGDEEDR